MNRTNIEYLTHTWNPIAMRCTPVSEGCANCWHLAMATRLAGNKAFAPEVRVAYAGEGPSVLVESRLTGPMGRKKPAVVGVQFMGDLFNDDVSLELVELIYLAMKRAGQHTFLLLTKRPDRMATALNVMDQTWNGGHDAPPLPNLWAGVTVEGQYTADARRKAFKRCPAAMKFVSYEPALGPVDWSGWEFVDWIISGGETGPGARPSHPDWHRAARDFCRDNGAAYFFKAWGCWKEIQFDKRGRGDVLVSPLRGIIDKLPDPFISDANRSEFKRVVAMSPVGKKAAGRLLDGKEHSEIPERRQQ